MTKKPTIAKSVQAGERSLCGGIVYLQAQLKFMLARSTAAVVALCLRCARHLPAPANEPDGVLCPRLTRSGNDFL